jgi:hypothetical protein
MRTQFEPRLLGEKPANKEVVMLNVGQVVLDLDRKEVMIFAGFEMTQNQKTGDCTSYTAFITRDGEYIFGKVEDVKRNYINFARSKDGKIPCGSFIAALGLQGNYFGVLDDEKMTDEHFEAAKAAIKEFEDKGWTMNAEGQPVLNEATEEAA